MEATALLTSLPSAFLYKIERTSYKGSTVSTSYVAAVFPLGNGSTPSSVIHLRS